MAGKRDGSWLVRLEGYPDTDTDDLTLDEVELAEKVSGVPYTLMDPHISVRVAKALLGVVLLRANLAAGMAQEPAEDKAVKAAGKLTTRKLHGAFVYQAPSRKSAPPAIVEGELADPPLSAPTSVAG